MEQISVQKLYNTANQNNSVVISYTEIKTVKNVISPIIISPIVISPIVISVDLSHCSPLIIHLTNLTNKVEDI